MNKIIEIIVSAQGETQLQTRGFAGAECRQASKFVESALGTQTSERLTEEFHHSSQEQHPLHHNQ